ncbi:MAGE family-domain-containing protein [Mycena maculata]|uniref:MAGE family-domain-containing protein n=1 Tax=Mycena maculata TaxID=230809 RepID=A0AAD7IWY2_9AGAR|nr:MAGE family-domain-containing protein [Mycena maculata]
MPRATTRSQKPARGLQAQPSQTQRSQKRWAEEPEDEEEDEDEEDEGRNMDVDDGEGGDEAEKLKRAANALVRLAMFTEHKRVPLRRDEISKKVLGSNTRSFARVLAAAQHILHNTLGMELVELRSRAELDKETAPPNTNQDDLEEARKATGVKKKSAAAGSKTYILRSTLPARVIEQAALTREDILEEEAADAPSDDDDDDEVGGSAPSGSIISWCSADHVGPLGVLYVILALILVSGRVMGDQDLRATLKRLRLPAVGTIGFSAASTHRTLTLDAYLTTLLRQGFLDRQQVGEAKKGGNKGKRGRVAQADDEAGQTYEWRWGARAQSEVGEVAICQFIAEFMIGEDGHGREEPEEEEEGAGGSGAGRARTEKRRADKQSKLDKMAKGIERAAGGQLAEIM